MLAHKPIHEGVTIDKMYLLLGLFALPQLASVLAVLGSPVSPPVYLLQLMLDNTTAANASGNASEFISNLSNNLSFPNLSFPGLAGQNAADQTWVITTGMAENATNDSASPNQSIMIFTLVPAENNSTAELPPLQEILVNITPPNWTANETINETVIGPLENGTLPGLEVNGTPGENLSLNFTLQNESSLALPENETMPVNETVLNESNVSAHSVYLNVSWFQGLSPGFSNLKVEFVQPDGAATEISYTVLNSSNGEWALLSLERAQLENETIRSSATGEEKLERIGKFALFTSRSGGRLEIAADALALLENNETVRIITKSKEKIRLGKLKALKSVGNKNIRESCETPSSCAERNIEVLEIDSSQLSELADSGAEKAYLDSPMSISLSDTIPLIRADLVHTQLNYTGEGVAVCLLDTGVDFTLASLDGKAVSGFDFVNNDTDSSDDNGHGTLMASVIHAVAPNATIFAVKVLNSSGIGYSSDIIAGIDYCRQLAMGGQLRIISMSFGGGQFEGYCNNVDPVAEEANAAVADGLFAVASTGNDGAAYITAPACAENATAVSSSSKSDVVSSFSNMNGMADLLAPGEITQGSGTSISAAHVSGAAALLLQSNSSLLPLEAQERFRTTGRLIDFNGANYTRIDIYNAVLNNITGAPSNQTANQSNETGNYTYGAQLVTAWANASTLSSASGCGIVSWVTSSNANKSDNAYATVTIGPTALDINSRCLKALNYSFSIPSDNQIDGIEVRVECSEPMELTYDIVAQLYQNNVGVGSTSPSSVFCGIVEANNTLGGPTDKWGTTWTPAQINNNSGFGFGVAFQNDDPGTDATVSIDWLGIRVYYSAVANNTAPNITAISVVPASPNATANISCNVTVRDAEQSTTNVTYEWYKNGANQTSLAGTRNNVANNTATLISNLTSGNLSWGENWSCRARAYDGANYSSWNMSANATISTSCANLSTAGTTYNMTASVSASGYTCFNVTAQNVTLDCKGYNATGNNAAGTYGLFTNQYNTTVKNCNFRNFSTDIGITGVSLATVQNTSMGTPIGLLVNNTNNSAFYNLTFTNITSKGIYVTNSSNRNNFTNISINASGGSGMYVDGGQNNSFNCSGYKIIGNAAASTYGFYTNQNFTTVKNCNITNFTYGVFYTGAVNGTVYMVNSTSMTTRGVNFEGGSNYCSISGVYSQKSGNDGIRLYQTSNCVVANSVGNTTDYAVGMDQSSSNNNFVNVSGYASSSKAIMVAASSNGNNFTNCTANASSTQGLYISGASNNKFVNLTAYAGASGGAVATDGSGSNNNITNSSISSSSNALAISVLTANIVSNSTITTTGSGTYSLSVSTNSNQFINNTFVGASAAALVSVSGTGAGNTFYWNNFTATTGKYVNDSSSGTNYYNSTEGNRWLDVMNGSIVITGTTPSTGFPTLFVGTSSTYNNSTSSKVIGNVSDFRPLTTLTQINISFVPPTPQNGTITADTNLTANVSLNISAGFTTFNWNWNGTNYTFYDSSLVLAYNLNNVSALGENGSSNNTFDASNYGNNGTCRQGAACRWNASGAYGSGISFNGTQTDWVNASNASSLNNFGNLTLEAWVYPVSAANNVFRVIEKDASPSSCSSPYDAFQLGKYDTNNSWYFCISNSSGRQCTISPAAMVLNAWSHLVGTYNGSALAFYVNGTQVITSAVTGTIISSTAPVGIGNAVGGCNTANTPFNGTLDEVRIYNRSMTAAEVRQHYYSSLYKYNTSKWQFVTNQANLSAGNYTYYACANYTGGSNCTETRTLNSGNLACSNLSTAGQTYNMALNLSISGSTCFNVTAANVTLNCAGYTITGNNTNGVYGAYSNQSNTTVKNCIFRNWIASIYLDTNANRSTLNNNTVRGAAGATGSPGVSAYGFYVGSIGNYMNNSTITNLTAGSGTADAAAAGGSAYGVYVASAGSSNISNLSINSLRGGNGTRSLTAGGAGGAGGGAYGIYFNAAASSSNLSNNNVSSLRGWNGGNGCNSTSGAGGNGGAGGVASAFHFASSSSTINLTSNAVSSLTGGNGGNGNNTTQIASAAGAAGIGGNAYAFYFSSSASGNRLLSNNVSTLLGGNGGNGARGGVDTGGSTSGGAGGNATAHYFGSSSSANNVSSGSSSSLTGGNGGTGGTASNAAGRPGGAGGNVHQAFFSSASSNSISSTNFTSGTGGTGGTGGDGITSLSSGIGGAGGTAYGIYFTGASTNNVSALVVSSLAGGTGGAGGAISTGNAYGAGGIGGMVSAVYFISSSALNNVSATTISSLAGGTGGLRADGNGSTGGAAYALYFASANNTVSVTAINNTVGGSGRIGSDGTPGAWGGIGGFSAAVYFTSSATGNNATITTINNTIGGTGGNGGTATEFSSSNGGPAGAGGNASAAYFNTSSTLNKLVATSVISTTGGAGGLGGSGDPSGGGNGSTGGNGGLSWAIYSSSSASSNISMGSVAGTTGGAGGNGGSSGMTGGWGGNGGNGSDAYAAYFTSSNSTNVSSTSFSGSSGGAAGTGGEGIIGNGVAGNAGTDYGAYLNLSNTNLFSNVNATATKFGINVSLGNDNTFLGSKGNSTGASFGIHITSNSNRTVLNSTIGASASNSSIYIDGGSNVSVDCLGLSMTGSNTNNTYGVYTNQFNTTIKNCNISGFQHGVYWNGADNGTINNVNSTTNCYTACGAYSSGIYFDSSANYNVINNSNGSKLTAYVWPHAGIYIGSSTGNAIANTVGHANVSVGLMLDTSTYSTLSNVTAVTSWGVGGLRMNNADNNNITDSSATGTSIYAMYLQGGSTGNLFRNVTFSSSSNPAAYIFALSNSNTFNNTTFSSSSQTGIYLTNSSNSIFANSTIAGGGATRYALQMEYANNSTFYNVTFSNPTGTLVMLNGSSMNNTFWWNNFTAVPAAYYYVNDTVGGNYYNRTNSSGGGEGNIWADVVNNSVQITGTADVSWLPGFWWGSSGTGWPYSNTTSGKVAGNVVDYAPITNQTVTNTAPNMTGAFIGSAAANYTYESGLMTYWKMDELNGTNASDSSGNGNNGTVASGVSFNESGRVGRAYQFDGTTSSYVLRNNTDFPTSELTVEFWEKNSNLSKTVGFFSYAISAANNNHFLVFNQANLNIYINSTPYATGVSIADTDWHHVAVTWRNSDGQLKVYKDGVLNYSNTSIGTGLELTSGGCLVLAQDQDAVCGGLDANQAFQGAMDDVRVYNRVLSAAEVNQTYNQTLYAYRSVYGSANNSTDADGTNLTHIYNFYLNGTPIAVLNMPFDTNMSMNLTGAVRDYSGNNNNGTLGSGTAANMPVWNASGKVGGAYTFDGSNDYISISDNPTLEPPAEFTVEAWAYPIRNLSGTPGAVAATIAGKGGWSNGYRITYANITALAAFTVGNGSGSGTGTTLYSTSILPLNAWTLIAGTYSANSKIANLYINGTLVRTVSDVNYTPTNSNLLYIGYDPSVGNTHYFNGSIDQVMVHNRSLSADEIAAHYNLEYNRIVASELAVGQVWNVSVTPNDGLADGPTMMSSQLIVENSSGTDACGILGDAGRTYNLTQSVSIAGATCFNVTAQNVTLNCAGYTITGNNTTGTYGFYTNQFNTTLRNCDIRNFQHAIFWDTADNGTMDNDNTTITHASGYGIYLFNGSDYNSVTNSRGNSTDWYGVHLNSSSYNTLAGITAVSSSYRGMRITLNSNFNTITNATVNAASNGFWISASHNNSIRNLTATGGSAIFVDAGSYNNITNSSATTTSSYAIEIAYGGSYNIIANSSGTATTSGTGVLVLSADSNTLNNVTGTANSSYGISINSSADNALVNSSGASNSSYGIYVNTNSHRNSLNRTAGSSNYSSAVYVDGGQNVSLDCQGISLTGTNTSSTYGVYSGQFNTTVKNCNISNFQTGVYFNGTDNGTIRNVSASSTHASGYGIYFNPNSNYNLITNTTATAQAQSAIYLRSSSSNIINSSVGNSTAGDGIALATDYSNPNANNTIANSSGISVQGYGISTDTGSNNSIVNSTGTSTENVGIMVWASTNGTIANATGWSNYNNGIGLFAGANFNVINGSVGNNTGNSFDGIYVYNSNSNIIANSTASSSARYSLWLRNSNNSQAYNNTFLSGSGSTTLVELNESSNNNTFYWNNFTNTSGYYVNDSSGGLNYYNTTNGTQGMGNRWFNVVNGSVTIYSANSTATWLSGFYYGDSGAGWPYSNSTSLNKTAGNVTDYAPFTTLYGLFVDTVISVSAIDFGNVDPGTTGNPADFPVNLTNTANSNTAVDLYLNNTNTTSGGDTILYNYTKVNLANDNSTASRLNGSSWINSSSADTGFVENLGVGSWVGLYFWQDVLTGQVPGTYNSTIIIRAVANGIAP